MNFESKTNLSPDKLEELTKIKIKFKLSKAADSLIDLYTLFDELNYELDAILVSGLGVILTADAKTKLALSEDLIQLIHKHCSLN
jgi:hypothetical protein